MPPLMTPEEASALLGTLKANLPHITSAEGQKKAIDDLTTKVQAISERQLMQAQEARPNGDSLTKFVGNGGKLFLKSGRETIEFAGRQVSVDREGLFDAAPCDGWHLDLLRLTSARRVSQCLFGKGNTPRSDARILEHAAKAPREIRGQLEKAISDTAGSGAEWVPDTMSPQIYEEYYAPAGIDALFPMVDIPGPLVVPKISDTIRPYLKGKVTNDSPSAYTASTPTSSNTTLEPAGFAARVLIDDAATEDSVFPLLPEIQRRLARAIRDGYEDAMVNGDTAATHQDAIGSWNIRSRWGSSGLGGTADHRRAFIGFRALAFDRTLTVDQGSGQTIAKIMEELLGGLGERGNMNAVILVSPEVFFKKMLTDSNVLTVDKLGPNATLLNGQLAAISGVPVVMTRWITTDLAATGLYTGSGAKSGVLAISREEFAHYQRRAALVELEKDITAGAYNVVATMRRSMQTLSGSSSAVVKFGYNWL